MSTGTVAEGKRGARRWRIAALAVAGVVCAVFLAQALRKANRPGGYDLTSYLMSARALLDRTDPYATGSRFPYIYPLFLAFALIPLTLVPYAVANVAWFALNVAALWDVVRVTLRLCARDERSRGAAPLAVAAVLVAFFEPLQNQLLNGQVNLVVLALAMRFVERERARRDAAAALTLGAAIAVKIVPGLLLLYAACRRRLGLALCAAAAAVALCLAPAVLFYRGDALRLSAEYVHRVLLGNVRQPLEFPAAFSIGGAVARQLGADAPRLALTLAGAVAVIAALALVELAAARAGSDPADLAPLYLVAVLLANPVSEVHHLVLAIPAALVVATRYLRRPFREIGWPGALVVLLLALVLASKLQRAGPGYLVALLLLFGLGSTAALSPRRALPAGSPAGRSAFPRA